VTSGPSEAELAETVASGGPEATIHASIVTRCALENTRASGGAPGASLRELPKISVVLRGTLSDPTAASRSAPVGDGRDLEVLSTLGEGGMGRVFLARQHSLDREVAIKTVRDSATAVERAALLSEGAITGHLEHPGVIPVHALGVDDDGRPVLVMKRVLGVEWGELLEDPQHDLWKGRAEEAADRLDDHLDILMRVCDAAHFAHSRGIIHRDIKPQNVFIGQYREVYLGDWGLAITAERAKDSPPLCGTPAYMAPEMAAGEPVDARTDVYLLGSTLHRILTGHSRHSGETVRDAIQSAILSKPVRYPPTIPAVLGAIANRATSRDPSLRPDTAEDLRRAIADYLRHKGSIALGHSAVERLSRLRELMKGEPSLSDEQRQDEIDLVVTEARFALRQALDTWSENPVARGASAELDELLAARRSRAADLERLAREMDPAVARRQRALSCAALAVVGIGLSVASFVVDPRTVTPAGILRDSLAPLGILVVMTVALRRHVLKNVINRRIAANLLLTVAAVTVDRALGLLGGASASRILAQDTFLLAVIEVMAATLIFSWLGWCAGILFAGAIVAAAAPEQALHAFSVSTGAALLVAVWVVWRRDVRRAP
jgi:serine/threonine protein kinase